MDEPPGKSKSAEVLSIKELKRIKRRKSLGETPESLNQSALPTRGLFFWMKIICKSYLYCDLTIISLLLRVCLSVNKACPALHRGTRTRAPGVLELLLSQSLLLPGLRWSVPTVPVLGFIPALATPCENGHYGATTNKSCEEGNEWWNFELRKVFGEKKKAWLDLLSAKANHREQKKDILKDKPKDAESTYKAQNCKLENYEKEKE
ncbi:hypothetical protein EVAR_93848_1 [Eumeta japonica]|uniref:Uncharacterized protein n=1 Tax=Eumeta variegata TaxID=151549 RepID=A0A4C1TWK9_EUMVA|nr:hypothetical protein EVAR_93848_1 [Eumeta japonica]